MTRLLLITTVLLATAPAAMAQRVSSVDGSKLLAICTGRDVGPCDAYINGVTDSAAAIDSMPELSGRKLGICVPRPTKSVVLRETLVSSLRAHPQDSGRSAIDLTLRALKAAYPCGNTG